MIRLYASLGEQVLACRPRLGSVRLIAIDGPAGSGKTSFASRLAEHLDHPPVLHVDDLLNGWHDLEGVWPRLESEVLQPLSRGHAGRYQRYDWHAGTFAEWHDIEVGPFLVLEGVGSFRRESAPYVSLSVWVTAPAEVRLSRGLIRDGDELRPQWEKWMADEAAHFAANDTPARVDIQVDGNPGVPHDPATQFVVLGR